MKGSRAVLRPLECLFTGGDLSLTFPSPTDTQIVSNPPSCLLLHYLARSFAGPHRVGPKPLIQTLKGQSTFQHSECVRSDLVEEK